MSGRPFDIIYQGKTPLIAGLRWQAMQNGSRRHCRSWVKGVDASAWVMVPGTQETLVGYAQLGLSDLTTSQARRACSLALVILPHLNGNGWGVFHLEGERYWFVAATDGRLSPLSDVTGSLGQVEQVLQRFLDYVPPADAQTIFCPDSMVEHPGDTTPLSVLLSRSAAVKQSRLTPVSDRLPVILWTTAAVLLLAGWQGWQQYQQVQQTHQMEVARQAYLAARQKAGNSTTAAVKPWLQQPAPGALLKACARGWNVPVSIAGWLFSEAECADGQVRIAWHSPRGGNVADFHDRVLQLFPGSQPVFNIPGAADSGGIRLPVSIHSGHAGAELPDADEAMQRLTSYAQRLGVALTLSEDPPAVAGVDGTRVPLPWRSWRFTLNTDIPVDRIFGDGVPDSGIRISGVRATMSEARLHYQIQGILYAKS